MARNRSRETGGDVAPASQRPRSEPANDTELPETLETNPAAHVANFVAYCKRNVTMHGDQGDVGAQRRRAEARLLTLLCREPAKRDDNLSQFYTATLGGASLEATAHSDDEDGRMARIANAVRHHYWKTSLEECDVQQIREIPGWSDSVWATAYWNCRCETCMGFSQHLKVFEFMYIEVLERRFPWYFPDAVVEYQARSEHGIEDRSYEILKKSDLHNFAREHWKTFFGPLQQLMSSIAMDVDISRELTMQELRALAERKSGDVHVLFDGTIPKQRTYATIALLNDYRRSFGRGSEIPEDLDGQKAPFDDPPFMKTYKHNCEGTLDDHYCLGDRKSGRKRYIGVTDNLQTRHAQHDGRLGERDGSYFIAVLTGRRECFCQNKGSDRTKFRCFGRRYSSDSCGGWKLTSNSQSAWEEETARRVFIHGPFTELEENFETVEIIREFGMMNTRGGDYVIPDDADNCQSDISAAMRVFASVGQKCTLCFESGHHRSKCPRAVRGSHDDVSLRNLWNLRCSDSDERDNHYEVAKEITHALVSNSPVGRIVTLSEQNNERLLHAEHADEEPTMRRVIASLYGPDMVLRPLQQAALRHISSCKERPDITLTLPTAYGKTLVYLSAAVYEILLARREKKPGKVVVFLPYSALMSDVAENLANLTKMRTPQNEVVRFMHGSVVFDGDPRVRGMSMPYAGVVHVNDDNDTTERIRWTIWRGKSSDSNMSALEQEDIFQNADIVFTTPDKWAWPIAYDANRGHDYGDNFKCDSFIKMFGDKFIRSLRLCVVDEAHEFRDVLGGNMCELLKRMRHLKYMCDRNEAALRTILISATMPNPRHFTEQLTGKIFSGDGLQIVQETQTENTQQHEVFPCEPNRNPNSDDVAEVFDKVEGYRGARHKILCILKEELECESMWTELLKPCNFRGARRVLIFVHSKTVATSIIRLMKTKEFKISWDRARLALVVTPYHGDVVPHYRKLCEKKMTQFVSEPREGENQQIHFIIATSALEAGVNIKGLDVLIIPSVSRCTMRSVKQRLGRGGREANKPTVCILGWSEASQNMSVDSDVDDEDVDDGEINYENDQSETDSDTDFVMHDEPPSVTLAPIDLVQEPLRFLTSDLTPFGICSTLAMKIHGANQFLGNLHCLRCELTDCGRVLNDLLGNLADIVTRDVSDVHSILLRRLYDEMPALKRSGKVMSMRGISDHAIPIHEAEPDIEPMYNNTRGIRVRRAYTNKDLARISTTLMLKRLHWNAQFFTPHGSLVRVVDYKKRRGNTPDASRWMENISAVYVRRLTPGDKAYPYTTQGEVHEHVSFVQDDALGIASTLVERGLVRVRSTWLGFYYCSPYKPSALVRNIRGVGDEHIAVTKQEPHRYRDWTVELAVASFTPNAQDRIQAWEFFHPADSFKSGWRWNIGMEFPFAQLDDNIRSSVLRLLCAELRLRVSESIKCSPRLIAIQLLSQALDEKIMNAENDIQHKNLSRDHLKLQDAESWQACAFGKLIVYENDMTGIAMEGLRMFFPRSNEKSLVRETNTLLLDNKAKLCELWDFAVMDDWENSSENLRPFVVTSLEWLCDAVNAVGDVLRATWS